MTCRLFGAKSWPEPMLTYCQLDLNEIWIRIQIHENTIENVICERNNGHLVQGKMSWFNDQNYWHFHETYLCQLGRAWQHFPKSCCPTGNLTTEFMLSFLSCPSYISGLNICGNIKKYGTFCALGTLWLKMLMPPCNFVLPITIDPVNLLTPCQQWLSKWLGAHAIWHPFIVWMSHICDTIWCPSLS